MLLPTKARASNLTLDSQQNCSPATEVCTPSGTNKFTRIWQGKRKYILVQLTKRCLELTITIHLEAGLQVTKIYFDNLSRTILAESMKSYLAAAIQMTSLPDIEKNLVQAEELIELAMRQGAELVTLPENFSFLGEEADKIAQAAAIAKESEKFTKQWHSASKSPFLAAVSSPSGHRQSLQYRLANRPQWSRDRHYQKVHLFDVNLPTAIPIENPVRSWLVPNCQVYPVSWVLWDCLC